MPHSDAPAGLSLKPTELQPRPKQNTGPRRDRRRDNERRRARHAARRADWVERLRAWGPTDSSGHGPGQPDFRAKYPGYPFKSYVWNELVREAGYEPRLPGNHGKTSGRPRRDKRLANRQMVTGG